MYTVQSGIPADGGSSLRVTLAHPAGLPAGADGLTLDLGTAGAGAAEVEFELGGEALKALAGTGEDLCLRAGQGGIILPAALTAALVQDGAPSLTLRLSVADRSTAQAGCVSAGVYSYTLLAGDQVVTRFPVPVTLLLPLDLSLVRDIRKVIGAVYGPATDYWQPLGGMVAGGELRLPVAHFSTFAAWESTPAFGDISGSWGRDEIEVLAARQVVAGVTPERYGPEAQLTRAELAVLLLRTLYADYRPRPGTFSDVPSSAWYAAGVETAEGMGLVAGVGGGLFAPERPITREELAVLIQRYCWQRGAADPAGTLLSPVAGVSDYALDAVDFVRRTGLMVGRGDGWAPRGAVTRQEAAVILYRLLRYLGDF